MKRIKAILCGIFILATALCLFACGDPVEKIELEAGITPIEVEHHERTVYGDAYIPEEEKFPVVIFSHGYNGFQDDFQNEAKLFMSCGVGAITLTFCGSGARDKSGFGTTNMTLFTEKEDLVAVMDYAKRIKGFNGKLFLFGGSQGGMVSAMAGEERQKDVKGMILLYPGLSIPDDWNNRVYPVNQYPTYESIPAQFDYWGVVLGRDFAWTLRDFDIYANMSQFKKPVLIMHGTKDDLVPLAYSRRAAATYPNAELLVYEGAGHGFTPTSIPDAKEKMLDFVFENL